MTSPQQVLDVARSQLGTAEAADGSNPYGRAYGMDRVAWCAEFVWWCFTQAGAPALLYGKTAYTPTLAQWFRDHGAFTADPTPGDLVFYDWPDSIRRIQHVGIVEAVEPAAIVTIEGNTSTSSQGDGGRVMRRRRARGPSIVGYGHPAYSPTATSSGPDDLPTVRRGDTGPAVVSLQRWLNSYGWRPPLPVLAPDGDYGPATTAAVRGAQQQCGIGDGDGTIVGPKTKASFWARGWRA